MSNNACLALLLDGPMQSWGFASRFTRRGSALFPTKSGVIGLVAAAMGVNKFKPDEAETVGRLAALHCIVVALPRQRRGEPLPILRLEDFHTIGGGFDPDKDRQSMPRSADGKTLKNPVVSYRHFLLDARFGVLLEGEKALIGQAATALLNPKWGVWLGRKCCTPASPIFVAVAASQELAWLSLLKRAGYSDNIPLGQFDHVEDAAAGEQGSEVLNDTPIAFGAPIGQRHTLRRVVTRHRSTGPVKPKS